MVGKKDSDLHIMLSNIMDPTLVGTDLAMVGIGIVAVDAADDVVAFAEKVFVHVEVMGFVELWDDSVFETVSELETDVAVMLSKRMVCYVFEAIVT